MTVTSATGSVSSLGVGSGLDSSAIISSLMAVEARPLTLLQTKAASITTEISSLGSIQSLASAFADKVGALADLPLWSQTTSSSADPSVVTADTSSGKAATGTYAVSVSQLAVGQTVTSNAFSSSDAAIGSGTLTIQLGTWSGGSPPTAFADKAGSTPLTVTIDPANSSLSQIRDKINAANGGVTASIITDATGSRLSLRSTATGEENGFKITATEDTDDGNNTTGLSALNYDPLSGASQLNLNQTAINAKAKVNGIDVVSASNTLSNISDGLSITLGKVSDTPVNITVGTDTASMKTAINDFVTAYNALNAQIHTATKYTPGTTVAQGTSTTDGPLQGDPAVIGFQNGLRNIINTTSTTSSMYARLSDIGITVQADGSLLASGSKLDDALKNPDELKKLFTTQGTGPTDTGIAVRFKSYTDSALAIGGSLFTRNDGLKSELTRNNDQQQEMQTHLDATQARLTAQYQRLDTTMSQMSALSSYVTQQMALLAASA